MHFSRHTKDGNQTTEKGQTLKYFWFLTDMLEFENIGFTLPVEGKYKYLTCADCEKPCLGNHINQNND